MLRLLVLGFKAVWICFRHPLNQEFVTELVKHEQSRNYQRHFGIGHGPHSLPDGKYLRRDTEPFK